MTETRETPDTDPTRTSHIHHDLTTIAEQITPDSPAFGAYWRLIDRLARTGWSETERTSLHNGAIRLLNTPPPPPEENRQ